MTVRRVLVPELADGGDRLVLDASRSHHLARVLRASDGDRFEAFDGRGTRALVRYEAGTLTLDGPLTPDPPPPALALALALAKGPAVDQAIRAAVEVGATEVHLIATQRSLPDSGRVDRWERIAESAATQCGRADLPRIYAPAPLRSTCAALLERMPVWVAAPGAPPLGPRSAGPAACVIGPEGGLTTAEHDWLFERGARAAGLTPYILRVETAAPVMLAALLAAAAP